MDEASLHIASQSIVGPTEVVKIAVQVDQIESGSSKTKGNALVVVSNIERGAEEACVLKVYRDSEQAKEGRTQILELCPIYRDFSVAIEQIDSPVTSPFDESGHSVQASFRIVMTSADLQLSAVTNDIAKLGDLLRETKRLTDIADEHAFAKDGDSHTWVSYYALRLPRRSRGMSGFATNRSGGTVQPETFSSLLSFGAAKAVDGLPAFTSALGSLWKGTVTSSTKVTERRRSQSQSIFDVAGRESAEAPGPTALPVDSLLANSLAEGELDVPTITKLYQRKNEFVDTQTLSVHICTFNVNGEFSDPTQDLSAWILPSAQPDLVVVGLQEMDLRPEVLMVRHDLSIGEAWVNSILSTLHNANADREASEQAEYVEVLSQQLAGVWISVLSKKVLIDSGVVHGAEAASYMTGWGGFIGNKGACAIRLRAYDETLTFVNAHLAALQDQTDRRNADFHDISYRLYFPAKSTPNSKPGVQTSAYISGTTFFFGDLNYRLDHSIEGIQDGVTKKTYPPLLAYDQLKSAQANGRAFVDYLEGDINFPPSFKFDKGTDKYDTSEKERKPAWTDRILWRIGNKDTTEVECRNYASVMKIRTSDHKPVVAQLRVALPHENKEKKVKVLEDIQSSETRTL